MEKATFTDVVLFEHCTLDRPKFQRRSTFEKGLSLTGSTLIRPCLRELTVRGPFRCDSARVKGKLLIQKVRFEGRVRFWEAFFQGWADFESCIFTEEADFRSFHAEEGFVFNACRFESNALFRGSTVHKKFQFDDSHFDALLDLSKAKLHDFVYLERIKQGPSQRFAFANALAPCILVRPDQLDGRLASEEAGDHTQAMQEYGLLKRVFEGLHRFDQEDWAFYRFKVNQRLGKPRTWRKPVSKLTQFGDWLFLDLGCGYGTNPLRAVRASLAIILGFALVYAVGAGSLHIDHAPFDGDSLSLANRSMIGLLMSVSAFISGFGDIRDAAKGWMNLPLIAESLLGTLLWGLFIVAFSRKVIR
jgi:hypothetical protein